MSTRGAWGFRINGKDKVAYNHSDSYLSWLGVRIGKFVAETPVEKLTDIAKGISLIQDEDKIPSPAIIKQYEKYANTRVGDQTKANWYCLLREAQGNPEAYRDGGVAHMVDYSTFLKDSLFCEYAYIINLDEGVLEIYKGFNKGRKGLGRYAKKYVKAAHREKVEYYGVSLAFTVPLADLQGKTEKEVKAIFTTFDKLLDK